MKHIKNLLGFPFEKSEVIKIDFDVVGDDYEYSGEGNKLTLKVNQAKNIKIIWKLDKESGE